MTYTIDELKRMGVTVKGNDVHVSKLASIYSPEYITIGNHVRIDDFCILSGYIEIGNYVHIAVYSSIFGGKDGVIIDDFANISSRVAIYSISDDYSGLSMTNPMIPAKFKKVQSGQVHICRHCIIGTASTVLPDVTLGEGCAFGAYSLIKKTCEPWGIYGGIPCKFIKARAKDLLIKEAEFIKEYNYES